MQTINRTPSVERAIERCHENPLRLRCLSLDRGLFVVHSATTPGTYYRTRIVIDRSGEACAECSCAAGQLEREGVACKHIIGCIGYLAGVASARLWAERETMKQREEAPMLRPTNYGRTLEGFQI